jgi:hypothetical protein
MSHSYPNTYIHCIFSLRLPAEMAISKAVQVLKANSSVLGCDMPSLRD